MRPAPRGKGRGQIWRRSSAALCSALLCSLSALLCGRSGNRTPGLGEHSSRPRAITCIRVPADPAADASDSPSVPSTGGSSAPDRWSQALKAASRKERVSARSLAPGTLEVILAHSRLEQSAALMNREWLWLGPWLGLGLWLAAARFTTPAHLETKLAQLIYGYNDGPFSPFSSGSTAAYGGALNTRASVLRRRVGPGAGPAGPPQ